MRIIIINNTYPSSGEVFLANELKYIPHPGDVTLCPILIPGNHQIPEAVQGIKVFHTCAHITLTDKLLSLLCAGISVFRHKELQALLQHKNHLRNTAKALRFAYISERAVRAIARQLRTDGNDEYLFYSYWFYEAAYVAARLRELFPNSRFISRCHGYDLYEQRHRDGYLPFRKYLLSAADKICPISQQGKAYLLQRYGSQLEKKIHVYHLGTEKLHTGIAIRKDNHIPTIVSCSNMAPVKREYLIIQALMKMETPVRWYHIGDGVMKETLLAMAEKLPGNVQWQFLGQMANSEVQKFYAEHYVDAFVNVSESEGLPVSIMEAMSYGIPIIATDVGGVSEIVVAGENGILLNVNFKDEELSRTISDICNNAGKAEAMKNRSAEIWQSEYWASKNHKVFYSNIDV